MTDKIHCPVCGGDNFDWHANFTVCCCANENCKIYQRYYDIEMMKMASDGKKAQEELDRLKGVKEYKDNQ